LILYDPDHDRDEFIDELKVRMEQDPDNVMIPVCVMENEVVGYTICIKDSHQSYAWMAMAWVKPGVSRVVGRALQDATKTWCENKGVCEIRAETKRNELRAMERYGFKELAKIVSLRWEV
jgi:hypothetical protein